MKGIPSLRERLMQSTVTIGYSYPADGEYEIHVLLDKGNFRLIEFTVRASDIKLYRDENA